jgi:nitroimidazol reductase NimA-like FMN-containing flavoprotein (pyridoxamine 5'-phosphate oxidase superfamily)
MLSTIGANGYPYVIPVNYVYYSGSIYFHSAAEGHKLENIQNNSRVSFCVAADVELIPEKFSTKYKSIVIFGGAQEVFGREKEDGLLALVRKYSPEFIDQGSRYIQDSKDKTKVVKIEIEHITGKAAK